MSYYTYITKEQYEQYSSLLDEGRLKSKIRIHKELAENSNLFEAGILIDTEDNILSWAYRSRYLAKVNIPNEAKLVKDTLSWSTITAVDIAYIECMYDIFDTSDIDRMHSEGINLHANNEMLLIKAVEADEPEAVITLINKYNADVKSDHSLPFRLAIYHNRTSLLSLMISKGADFETMNGIPKVWAKKFGNEETLKVLRSHYDF